MNSNCCRHSQLLFPLRRVDEEPLKEDFDMDEDDLNEEDLHEDDLVERQTNEDVFGYSDKSASEPREFKGTFADFKKEIIDRRISGTNVVNGVDTVKVG